MIMRTEGLLTKLCILLCMFLLGTTSAWAQGQQVSISTYLTPELTLQKCLDENKLGMSPNAKVYWDESQQAVFLPGHASGDQSQPHPFLYIKDNPFANVSSETGFAISMEFKAYARANSVSYTDATDGVIAGNGAFVWSRLIEANTAETPGGIRSGGYPRYFCIMTTNGNLTNAQNVYNISYHMANEFASVMPDENGNATSGYQASNGGVNSIGKVRHMPTDYKTKCWWNDINGVDSWHQITLLVAPNATPKTYIDGAEWNTTQSRGTTVPENDPHTNQDIINDILNNIGQFKNILLGRSGFSNDGDFCGYMRNIQIVSTGSMGTVSLLRSQSAFNKTLLANSMDLTTAARLIPQGSTVTLAGGKGYMVNWDNIKVRDAENQQITLNGTGSTRTFTMPAGVVTVYIVDDDGNEVTNATEETAEQYIPHKPEAAISFAQTSVNKKYGDAAFSSPTLSHKKATDNADVVDGKGTVTYESGNTSVATVNAESGEVTITGVGSAEIFAKVEDSDDYTYPVEKISYQLTVDKGVAELTVANGSVTGGTTGWTPTATHKLGNTVVTDAGIGTVTYAKTTDADNIITNINSSTGEITFNTANTGTATITATVADGTLYTYSKKSVTFTVTVVGSGSPHNISLSANTYNNQLTANGTELTNTAFQINQGTNVQLEAAKGYKVSDWSKITVKTGNDNVSVDANHRFTMPDGDVTVTISEGAITSKIEAEIAFTDADASSGKVTETYVGTDKTLTRIVSNKLKSNGNTINSGAGTVTYESGNTSVATVNNNGQVTIRGLGTTVITATVADNDTYYYNTTSVSYTLEVGKGTATVSTAPTANSGLTYTKSAQDLINAGTAGTDNAMRYKLGSGAWETTIPKATNAGTYTVFFKAVGSGTNAQYYNESSESSLQVNIAKADGTVSALSIAGWTYGDEAKDFTATTTNDVQAYRAEYKQKTADDNTYSLDVPTAAGNYTLKVTFNSTDNYKSVSGTADFTIARRAATVTATDQTIDFGGTIKSAVATGITIADLVTVSGLADGDEISAVTLNTTQTAAGTYDNSTSDKTGITISSGTVTIIKTSGDADMTNNYTLTLNNGKLTINKVVAVVKTAPTANTGLTYTGTAQQLVSAGATDHGTMVYSTTADGNYTAAIPTGTDAKYSATASENYTVYYKVQPDANHTASEAEVINNIQIAAKNISNSDEVVGNFTNMPDAGMEYTGSAIEPEGEVRSTANPVATLVRNQDFDIAFTNNTDPANSSDANAPTVTISGKGNYTGTVTMHFTIWAHNLNEYSAGTAGWHTLYTSDGPFDVSSLSNSIEVYTISAVDASAAKATLTPQTQILRNVPMIINVKGDMTSTPLPKAAENSQSGTAFSGFKGATSAQTVSNGSEYHYVLAGNKLMEMHGTSVPAYRCYLQMARLAIYNTAAARQRGFSLSFDNKGHGDDTTGIDSLIDGSQDDDRWYDMRGVRIPKPTRPGVYVHNGRVVTVKK